MTVFTARCFAVAQGLCILLSVGFVDCIKMSNHILKIFSPLGNHAILVFQYQTRTVLTRRVRSYGLPAWVSSELGPMGGGANSAALSDYGVNAAGIAEIVVIFRNDSSLAEMPGSFA